MSVPPGLTPETFADRLYDAMAPVAREDATVGWSLLILVNAIGQMFQLVEEWVRDTPDGIGWSLLVDLDRCPPEALPWLAQFAGVRLLPGSSEAEQRTRIASTDGFSRGTPAAMRGAAAATLTGNKTVVFRERWQGNAYELNVVTYAAETPNVAATEAALIAQKPAGIVLLYATHAGQDYASLKAGNANYATVNTKYPDYESVKVAQPA